MSAAESGSRIQTGCAGGWFGTREPATPPWLAVCSCRAGLRPPPPRPGWDWRIRNAAQTFPDVFWGGGVRSFLPDGRWGAASDPHPAPVCRCEGQARVFSAWTAGAIRLPPPARLLSFGRKKHAGGGCCSQGRKPAATSAPLVMGARGGRNFFLYCNLQSDFPAETHTQSESTPNKRIQLAAV